MVSNELRVNLLEEKSGKKYATFNFLPSPGFLEPSLSHILLETKGPNNCTVSVQSRFQGQRTEISGIKGSGR
jgi:hypothetical protein